MNADGPVRALSTLRTGIRLLNDAHGTANTDSGGYHETITAAYVVLIAEFLRRAEASDRDLAEHVQALLASPVASREALLVFYSKPRLFSVEARRGWVEPDRAPLSLDACLDVTAATALAKRLCRTTTRRLERATCHEQRSGWRERADAPG